MFPFCSRRARRNDNSRCGLIVGIDVDAASSVTITQVRVRGRVKLRGIGNLSRYPPSPSLSLPSFLPSFSFAVRDGGKRVAPRALQKEVRERCDRSNAGYYKTKDDGLMPIIKEEGSSGRRG